MADTNSLNDNSKIPSMENEFSKVSLVASVPSGGHQLTGIAECDEKYYAVFGKNGKMFVFSGSGDHQIQLEREVEIKNGELSLGNAFDIAASSDKVICICDFENSVVWTYHVLDKKIGRIELNGKPNRLSVSPSGELLVLVWGREAQEYAKKWDVLTAMHLYVYRPTDGSHREPIKLDEKNFPRVYHAVQSSDGKYILAHAFGEFQESEKGDERFTQFPGGQPIVVRGVYEGYRITEIDEKGGIIRQFQTSVNGIELSWPKHLAITPEGTIFCADSRNNRVIQIDSKGEASGVVNSGGSTVDNPVRLCYIEKKRQLIVAQQDGNILFVSV